MEDQIFICRNPECTTQSFIHSVTCPRCKSVAHASSSSKATPSETPDAAVVLVLDGGGMRGLSTLFIEKALMERVKDELKRQTDGIDHAEDTMDEPCPCDYFTFMIGTSTGGIIATLQGIFGLNVTKCIKEYKTLGEKVFGRPRHLHIRQVLLPRSKYDSDDFEEIISHFIKGENEGSSESLPNHPYWKYFKKFVSTRFNRLRQKTGSKNVAGFEEDMIPPQWKFNRPNSHCKTAAIATRHREAGQTSFIFRSYDHERNARHGNRDIRNPGKASGASIVEVVRATSAAPSYFKEKKIPTHRLQLEMETPNLVSEERFIDGGTAANNPSDLAWDEVCAWQIGMSGEDYGSASSAIGCIVSIGCGRTKWQMFANATDSAFRKYLRISLSLSKIVTDTGPSHRATRARARESGVPYFRFNVHEGLEETKLDEWDVKKRKFDDKLMNNGKKMSTYDFIKEVTDYYLQGKSQKTAEGEDRPDVPVAEELQQCAKVLVQYKLARDEFHRRNKMVGSANSDLKIGGSNSTLPVGSHDDDAILPASSP